MDRMIQFFNYSHLPLHLQEISKPFFDLAIRITDTLPENPERTVSLRKLLESKDCAVRAALIVVEKQEKPEYQSPFSKPFTSASSGMGIPKR